MRYLSYRPRSENEVRNYLRLRNYPADTVENVLVKLRALNYLNDESFAHDWALSRAQSHGYGPRRIEQELRAKGIDQTTTREIVRETFAAESEASHAKRLLTRRFKGQNLEETKVMRRAAAFLQRRGYSSKVIFDLLRLSIDED
ncbi:MAG TPA: regulatory protein RecX [Candidatus Saccharimonadales bacterium]|nr:regulatory protein RecX [Candidatus Saccharimonadales bacterium]